MKKENVNKSIQDFAHQFGGTEVDLDKNLEESGLESIQNEHGRLLSLTVPDELFNRLEKRAKQENKTPEQLASEVVTYQVHQEQSL